MEAKEELDEALDREVSLVVHARAGDIVSVVLGLELVADSARRCGGGIEIERAMKRFRAALLDALPPKMRP